MTRLVASIADKQRQMQDRVIIGSAETCDLVIDSPVVSRRHCVVRRQPHGFLLEDLNSRNGVYVDGVRIDKQTLVREGDRVTLGKSIPMPWDALLSLVDSPDGKGQRANTAVTIGRLPTNDIVLVDRTVSNRHARVIYERGEVFIEDLGSRNGTYLIGENAPLVRALLRPQDAIRVGSTQIPAEIFFRGGVPRLPAKPPHDSSPLKTAEGDGPAIPHGEFDLSGRQGLLLLGRDRSCDFQLDYPMVSLRHAQLAITGRQATIADLGSSNGTYVNGVRISRPTTIRPGDVIALGSVWFVLSDDGLRLARQGSRGDITLQAAGLGITVANDKQLLEKVDLVILPGELVGLMGPSGAGKSTLIAAINGYLPPTRGTVSINGRDLYDNYDEFRGMIGYVPQDDIMHADLTVSEALYYSARLRLPADYSDDEIQARVQKVVEDLSLQGTEKTRIGNAEKRGISGGQRKRVNVAMELLTDPPLLFLDEPTSGLSSEDALALMRLLRELADRGKTVVLTIHQPSLESYRLMDNLIVVGKDASTSAAGRLAYFGPAFPDAITFFEPQATVTASPDAVLRGMGTQSIREWVAKYENSDLYKRFVVHRLRGYKKQSRKKLRRRRPAGGLSQYLALVRRGMAIKLKDSWNTGVLLLQAPLIALLIGLVFGPTLAETVTVANFAAVGRATATTVFLLGVSALWFGCSNSARDIVAESAVYRRERMVGLSIPSYLASKVTLLGLLCAFQCAVLLIIVGWLGNLSASWPVLYFALFIASLVGVAIGLTVSVAARTGEVAAGVLPLVILPMVILGGVLLPLHDLPRTPVPMNAFAAVMPSRWAFESLILPEAAAREVLDTSVAPPVIAKPTGKQFADGADRTDMAEPFFESRQRWKHLMSLPFLVMQMQATCLILFVGALLRGRDTV